MAKSRSPNTARKPPVPSDSPADIEDWIQRVMPELHPVVKRLHELICAAIPGLQYAVKWKKAYRTRYVKLKVLEEVQEPEMQKWIEQAGRVPGWK